MSHLSTTCATRRAYCFVGYFVGSDTGQHFSQDPPDHISHSHAKQSLLQVLILSKHSLEIDITLLNLRYLFRNICKEQSSLYSYDLNIHIEKRFPLYFWCLLCIVQKIYIYTSEYNHQPGCVVTILFYFSCSPCSC